MRLLFVIFGISSFSGLGYSHPQNPNAFTMNKGFIKGAIEAPFSAKLAKKAGPSVGQAPLDINNEVSGTLGTLSSLVGVLGGTASKAVMGLTGVSITDCAGSLKGSDLNTLSCEDFLDTIAQCDSLSNIKDLVLQAKKSYQKKPNKKAPCFKNKSKSKSKKP